MTRAGEPGEAWERRTAKALRRLKMRRSGRGRAPSWCTAHASAPPAMCSARSISQRNPADSSPVAAHTRRHDACSVRGHEACHERQAAHHQLSDAQRARGGRARRTWAVERRSGAAEGSQCQYDLQPADGGLSEAPRGESSGAAGGIEPGFDRAPFSLEAIVRTVLTRAADPRSRGEWPCQQGHCTDRGRQRVHRIDPAHARAAQARVSCADAARGGAGTRA